MKYVKLTIALFTLMLISFMLGKSQVPEPEKIEVIKIVEKEVIKTVQSAEKISKVKNTLVKHISSDGSVTETTSNEIEVSDKKLDEFLSEKLKEDEQTEITMNEYTHGFSSSVGVNREKQIIADFEYLHGVGKLFDKPIYAKLEISSYSDINGSRMQLDSIKVGGVLLLN